MIKIGEIFRNNDAYEGEGCLIVRDFINDEYCKCEHISNTKYPGLNGGIEHKSKEWLMSSYHRVEYYYLKQGELVQEGDEVDVTNKPSDPDKWIKATAIGSKAPNPSFWSHRKYRRLVQIRQKDNNHASKQ